MDNYYINGKQILHNNDGGPSYHIADAVGNEEAHFLATAANQFGVVDGYIENALRTLSPAWYGNMVAKHTLVSAVNDGIKAANALDKIKKTLFYGRDNNLISNGQADVQDLPAHMDCGNADAVNIIHAILGKFTEAGELLEALKACYNGGEFDHVNANEEIGDGFWYDAILLNETGGSFPESMALTIAKLRARFPAKFTEDNANVRDLDAERAILESHAQNAYLDPYPVINDDNGGDSVPVAIVPSEPASGAEAVSRAAEASATAFEAIQNVGNVEQPPLASNTGELHKPTAARLHPLPQEDEAQRNSGKYD